MQMERALHGRRGLTTTASDVKLSAGSRNDNLVNSTYKLEGLIMKQLYLEKRLNCSLKIAMSDVQNFFLEALAVIFVKVQCL